MSDDLHRLSLRERVELLCWLTCGSLVAYYLNGEWPGASFYVEAAHKWLDRHRQDEDWLFIAKLSAVALEIAQRHVGIVDAAWAREAIEEILDTDDLRVQSRLAMLVMDDCQRALDDKRLAQ